MPKDSEAGDDRFAIPAEAAMTGYRSALSYGPGWIRGIWP